MATNPVTPAPAKSLSSVLSALAETNTYVSLGIEVAGVVIPLVKGLIQQIKQIATGEQTVAYQVLLQTDEGDLQQVITVSDADLTAINAELVRLGKTPLPIPATAAPAPEPALPAQPAAPAPEAPTPAAAPAPGSEPEPPAPPATGSGG